MRHVHYGQVKASVGEKRPDPGMYITVRSRLVLGKKDLIQASDGMAENRA